MTTLSQLIKTPRQKKKKSKLNHILQRSPQKKGICLKIYTTNPKKPNSAQRKVALVKLSNSKRIITYIPGEGHNLQEHNYVLVRGGRVKDLPGVKFHLIRGTLDLNGVTNRKKNRSKYGTKKPQ
uniref:Ribosomal protein S12 n=1 Tax=Cyanidium caldarium TaxID=2771 RepID=A0A7H0WBC4_CYACA|nr:ribosomal protein S12 [Cyanidium caldarium]QNR39853.1 ribosomal protein S12 [Cyanidium caldarium]